MQQQRPFLTAAILASSFTAQAETMTPSTPPSPTAAATSSVTVYGNFDQYV